MRMYLPPLVPGCQGVVPITVTILSAEIFATSMKYHTSPLHDGMLYRPSNVCAFYRIGNNYNKILQPFTIVRFSMDPGTQNIAKQISKALLYCSFPPSHLWVLLLLLCIFGNLKFLVHVEFEWRVFYSRLSLLWKELHHFCKFNGAWNVDGK